MKYLVLVLLSIFLQVQCRSLTRLGSKENETEVGQHRSARVHRTSIDELSEDDQSRTKTILTRKISKSKSLLGSRKIDELLSNFNEEQATSNDIAERQDVDLAINGKADSTTSMTIVKPVLKDTFDLKNLLNSPEELDIYYQDNREADKKTKSKTKNIPKTSLPPQIESASDSELKIVKNIAQYLDSLLVDVQNHVNHIRNIFEKLCRKHRPTASPPLDANRVGKIASMYQPKKVSIL